MLGGEDGGLLAIVFDDGVSNGLAFGDQADVVLLQADANAFAGEGHAHRFRETAFAAAVGAADEGDRRAEGDVDVAGADEAGGLDGGEFHAVFSL